MVTKNNFCSVCDEPIYNRICALCLTDKIESWLESHRLSLVKDFRNQVRRVLDSVKRGNKMFCVFCRVETEISVCPICFMDKIAAWLSGKDQSIAGELTKNFHYTSPARNAPRVINSQQVRQP